MAKVGNLKETALATATTPSPSAGIAVPQAPDFLVPQRQVGGAVGTELLAQYIRPPRLKIVQKQALPPLSDTFFTGDLIISPDNVKVASVQRNAVGKSGAFGERFWFTPLFFYPEWCRWNPFTMRGSAPPITERTQDPRSLLARKCQNPATWHEPHPEHPNDDKWNIRNVEHLNFVCLLHSAEDAEAYVGEFNPVIMTFSRGQHRDGTAFIGKLAQRKCDNIAGCVFEGRAAYRPDKGKGDWYGLNIDNPGEDAAAQGFGPWITDKAWYDNAVFLAEGWRTAHKNATVQVDYEDDVDLNVDPNVVQGRASEPGSY